MPLTLVDMLVQTMQMADATPEGERWWAEHDTQPPYELYARATAFYLGQNDLLKHGPLRSSEES